MQTFRRLPPAALAGRGERFPFEFQRESGVPAWAAFRPEGHPLKYTLYRPWRAAFYLRKYRLARYGTAPDELAHFNRQRLLLRAMLGRAFLPPEHPAARLAAVGDIMWVRANWNTYLQPALLAYLRRFDAVIGNLETPVDAAAPPVEWYKFDAVTFNSDPRLLDAFSDPAAGRNSLAALSLANNHVFDRGDSGARNTLALLDRLGIAHTGVRQAADDDAGIALFERNGIRFGLYGAAYGYNDPAYRSELVFHRLPGLAPWPYRLAHMDLSGVRTALAAMDRAGADFRVIFLHWGHEFELYPTPVQMQLGHTLAAMGFDLVLGSHPHVVQPCEICLVNGYERLLKRQLGAAFAPTVEGCGSLLTGHGNRPRKSLICYSLGNFATAMLSWETRLGAILSLRVRKDPVTGAVDWEAPDLDFAYNLLAIHNHRHGRKELHLLSDYVRRKHRLLRMLFPIHRRIMGFLARHMVDAISPRELRRRSCERDFTWLRAWFNSRARSG